MEIYVNSCLPISMLSCLHQGNAYMKRKLRVWRAQKCNPLVSAKSILTYTSLQATPFHAGPNRADNGRLQKFGSTYRHGTVFAPFVSFDRGELNVVSLHCSIQKS